MEGNFIIPTIIFFLFVAVILCIYIAYRHEKEIKKLKPLLSRHHKNPLLSPIAHHEWEREGSFNPAAIIDDEGRVHILYRAIGSDGMSRIGYSSSEDGFHFDTRVPFPVFTMENPRKKISDSEKRRDPVLYPSGGSWGGCEDPRMVRLDGRIYVTFNAFDGWDFIRIAAMSIDEKDFFEQKWKWSRPLLISPENQINKNWVLFPEKIDGKFAILHSISDADKEVHIDYVDALEELGHGKKAIKSKFGQKVPRETWDTWVRGAGPPPLKTDLGWLVLYHAIDKKEPDRYKIGAMLLDLNNPRKMISRCKEPLLMPDMWYENDWKPGVVYACGAVVKDEKLFVYYGGGDKHVCVASAPLSEVLQALS
ncbi:MAG: hypothetical protein V4697_00330 [Patescibacteria group bacterium]